MFWSFLWYLILEMENHHHHHHHPPKEMVSKLCHGQAPATRLKRHCPCCLSVVSSAGYRPVMFCWASGRSLDNSVCGTWKNLGKDKVHEWFLKVWDLEFHIQCSHSNRNRIAIAQQWVQVFWTFHTRFVFAKLRSNHLLWYICSNCFFAYFVCSCEPFRFSSQHVKPKLSNWTTNNIENQS